MSIRADDPANIEVTWGVNRWVLLERGDTSHQVQTKNASALARAATSHFDIPDDRAKEWARAQWKTRPADAGAVGARAGESAHSATGLPWWVVLVVLIAVVVGWVIWARYSGDAFP
jgi:hypothetical protein